MSEQSTTTIFDGDPMLDSIEQKKFYPNLKQTWLLLPIYLGILIVLFVAIVACLLITGKNWKNTDLYGGPLVILWLLLAGGYTYIQKKKFEPAYNPSFRTPPLPILLLVIFIIPTFIISFTGIISWFHVNAWLQLTGVYQGIFPDNNIKYLVLLIIFPFLEEFIFRGIILDGLLKNRQPRMAIIHAALFVGVLSLSPVISSMMFLVSLFNGWLYYKTQNLSINIFIHFIFNLFPLLVAASVDKRDYGGSIEELIAEGYTPFIVISLPVLGICCFLLQHYLNKKYK
jgi:membrane protease YdiL (CAAX protease family)